jgi:hypothetical protein
VDACNPLLQAHPTWARDEHEGRGIPTSLTPVSGRLTSPPSRSASRRPIWAGARGDISLVGLGTPRSRNADKLVTHPLLSMIISSFPNHMMIKILGLLNQPVCFISDGTNIRKPKSRIQKNSKYRVVVRIAALSVVAL